MSREPIVVGAGDLAAERTAARGAIGASGLPQRAAEAAPGPYGTTRAALDLLEGLEGGLAAGRAAERALRARIAADRARGFAAGEPTAAELRFAAAFGILVACEETLAATAGATAVLPDRPFAEGEVAPVLGAPAGEWPLPLARDLAAYLEHYRRHPDPERRLGDGPRLLACARSHLARMALAARRAAGAPEHAVVERALAESPLTLPGVAWAGLERRAAGDEEAPDLLDVGPEDVVGNAEVLAAGLKLARAVAAFDLAAGRNPRRVENPVLFVLGPPGCGKTVTAHAIGRAFLGLAAEAGLPARFRVVRRTDWASHYQNKSAADLLRIFRDELFGFPGVAGAYWPDIDTAFAARSDPDIRAEEKANLATLFGILDGTVGPRNGRWFLIADANTMAMDEAMTSRLTQDPKLARGPESAVDYVRLLRDVKLRAWRDCLPDEAGWARVGERLRQAGLSGRAVAAIAGRVAAEIEDVPEPPGFLRLGYEEKVRALRERARPVTEARILEHVAHYVAFEREAAERAERERFARRVEEIRLQLGAQAAALGLRPTERAPGSPAIDEEPPAPADAGPEAGR